MVTDTTSRTVFIDGIRADRAAWEALVASVPAERMTEPGAIGHWSVKDAIAHITVYERWTIDWIEPALRGDPPNWEYPAGDVSIGIDGQNAHYYEQNRDRELDDIQSESARTFEHLLTVIEQVPEAAFSILIGEYAPPVGAHYRSEATVYEAIDGNTAAHYREHTKDVQRWLGDPA